MNKGLHSVRVKPFSVFAPAPLGCVLYLPGYPGFGSTLIDRSPYGNHGTITGATWSRLPSGIWYHSYDGTDDLVDCGNNSTLNMTTSGWTALLWAYNGVNDANDRGMFFKTAAYGCECFNGILYGYVYDAGGDFIGRSGAPSAWLNVWNLYAITYDGGNSASGFKMYANGVRFDSANNNSGVFDGPTTTSNSLRVGDWSAQSNFLGKISLFRLIIGAMSPDRINYYFNQERHLFGV